MSISSTLRLNANELDINFVNSIKSLFKGKDIEIITKVIDKDFENNLKDVKEIFEDYKLNGEKNFVPFEEGNKELDNWLDSLNENSKIK